MVYDMKTVDALVWGKSEPRIPLIQHLIAVGACTKVYLEAESSSGILSRLCDWIDLPADSCVRRIAYVFAMHDIGKVNPHFLFRVDEIRPLWRASELPDPENDVPDPRFRHEQFGARVLRTLWGKRFPPDAAEFFASVIRLHHQGKPNDNTRGINCAWQGIRESMEQRVSDLFLREDGGMQVHLANRDALGVLLSGMLILMDWVVSSERFGSCSHACSDRACYEWALCRAHDVLVEYGLISDCRQAFPDKDAFDSFWPRIGRSGMRPLQSACETIRDIPAKLTIIEAPPGEGKTEAALYLAGQLCRSQNRHGIYMALPTTATSNQMVGRVRDMMRTHGLGETRLIHGSAWLVDETTQGEEELSPGLEDAHQAAAWLRPLRRALLSENAVGTVDQAMAAVLKIKYGMLRLTGLANKVLLIDEIHAYDAYMKRILVCLMQWCNAMGIPVILLSATLHRQQKEDYLRCFTEGKALSFSSEYPLITQIDDRGMLRECSVGTAFMQYRCDYRPVRMLGNAQALARYAIEKTAQGGCCCVMLNTVNRAQEVYEQLIKMGEEQVMLFHARFRMRRRAEIERECIRRFGRGGDRPERMILVCTQVVEQSLDIDFDCMISEIAPLDLLIQRAGRVHRHSENRRPRGMETPVVEVVVPDRDAPQAPEERYGVLGCVYAQAVLYNTEKWLGEGRTLSVPEEVRAAVDEVYETVDYSCAGIYVNKQMKENMSQVEAERDLFRVPKGSSFFGRMPSQCEELLLDDCEDLEFAAGGARTREDNDSVRVAFLPNGFELHGTEREQAKQILDETASIRLTGKRKSAIIQKSKKGDNLFESIGERMGIRVLRPEEDGFYRIDGRQYQADDIMGVREVMEE